MKLKLFVVATSIALLASAAAIAQQLDASQRSYQQARRVLDDLSRLDAIFATQPKNVLSSV